MESPHRTTNVVDRRLHLLALVSGMALALGLLFDPLQVWSNLLVGAYFLLTLGLGGAVFVALTYVAGAGWSVAFRRVPEAMARLIPLAGIALLIVLAARTSGYGWRPHGEGDVGTFWFKQLWLTPSFWLARAVAYIVVWSLLSRWLIARPRQLDANGGARLLASSVRISALFLAVYAVTISLASADWMMALEPMWFSTMWGVYNFAGMIQAALAAVVVLGLLLRRPGGPLCGVFSDEHLHDLGKLLLGFSCFWMYIWFSQYMLIWYTNMPEETSYFITRTQGPWGAIVVMCILLNWAIPFFVLLPRPAKRSAGVMMKVAVVVLIGRYLDLYLMVFPSTLGETPLFGVWEVASIGLAIATGSMLLRWSFVQAPAIPTGDPLLDESLHYHAS